MKDQVFHPFLKAQYAAGMALAQLSDRLTLEPYAGDPPWCYVAHFRCRGLTQNAAGGIEEHDRWSVGIRFPEDYLRARVQPPEVLTLLSPTNAFHPNCRHPFICTEVRPGMPLVEILHALHDLFTWNVFGIRDDGLNRAAAQWARRQPPERFPLDRHPLRRAGSSPARP